MHSSETDIDICLGHEPEIDLSGKFKLLVDNPAIKNIGFKELSNDHFHFLADVKDNYSIDEVDLELRQLLGIREKTVRVRRRKPIEGDG